MGLIENLEKWKSVFTEGEWEELVRQEREREALRREYPERVLRYIRLKFKYCEITRELIEDDQRWEEALKMPIDPDNAADCLLRKWKAN